MSEFVTDEQKAAALADNWKGVLNTEEAPVAAPTQDEPAPVTEEKTVAEPVTQETTPADANSGAESDTPKPDTKPTEPVVEFDDALLAHAEEHGFSAEEARAFPNPDALRRVLGRADKAMASFAKPSEKAPADRAKTQEPPAPAKQEAAAPATAAEVAEEYNLDPDTVDPDVVKAFNIERKRREASEGRVSQLEQRLAAFEAQFQTVAPVVQKAQEAQLEQIQHEVDKAFSGLGKGFEEVLGTVPTHKLAADSPLRAARDTVTNVAAAIAQAIITQGRKAPSIEELIRRAAYAEFGSTIHKNAKAEVKKEVEAESEADAQAADILPSKRMTKQRTQSEADHRAQQERAVADAFKRNGFSMTT